MGFISGGFANLDSYRIGNFTVERLVGRDQKGVPRWEVSCGRCGQSQFIGHLRLAPLVEGHRTQRSLQCQNPGCASSKNHTATETLADFLRQERQAAQRQAQIAAEAKAKAENEAVKERTKQAQIEALRLEFREFWLHQFNADVPESEIPSFKQWCGFCESARKTILERIRKEPAAKWKFSGLGER